MSKTAKRTLVKQSEQESGKDLEFRGTGGKYSTRLEFKVRVRGRKKTGGQKFGWGWDGG